MLRVLHTSDWHLGHTLHELDRWREHDVFLDWLMALLGQEQIDVLLLTGDVFDSANPSAQASGRWFGFLAALRRRYPSLDVIVIGGNHDSAARLDAPRPILTSMNIHILGGMPRGADGELDLAQLLIPVHDATGAVAGWVAAVPFLRPGDLPRVKTEATTAEGRLVTGMRALYQQVLVQLRACRRPGQAAIMTGHCLMAGAILSESSERKIQGGNQDALPTDVFPEELTYVALGHLHLPQSVGRETVRYAGAPLALSMAEGQYPHQVRILEIEDGQVVAQRSHRAPQVVPFIRLPDGDPASIEDVLSLIGDLPDRTGDEEEETLPFLEVRVSLDQPVPGLRRQVQEAVSDKAARLVKLTAQFLGDGDALADTLSMERLRDILPEEVFVRRYQRDHEGDPPPALLASFHELLNAVLEEGA